MTDQRQITNSYVEEYHAPEPSIPAAHSSTELTDDAVIIYDREDSQQWIWADEAVERTELR